MLGGRLGVHPVQHHDHRQGAGRAQQVQPDLPLELLDGHPDLREAMTEITAAFNADGVVSADWCFGTPRDESPSRAF